MTDAKTVSLHRFYFQAMALARTTGWRYGQAMFNHLLDVRPDLAERVRGTDADPFHCVSPNDDRFDRFVALIESEWTKSDRASDASAEIAELKSQVDAHIDAARRLVCPITGEKYAMVVGSTGEGESPAPGWHYTFGGPYTRHTLPEIDSDGALMRWVLDEDEGCWSGSESVPVRIVSEDEDADNDEAIDEARAEIARLRARVRVGPEDVRRAGVGWPHVVAWLKRAGWVSSYQSHGLAWRPEPGAFLSIIPGETGGPARAVGIIGDLYKRPGLDILDEMAAMQLGESNP